MKQKCLLVLCLTLLLGSVPSLQQQAEYIMGTVYTIKVFHGEAAPSAIQTALARIRDYDAALSDYREDSELSQLLARSLPGRPEPLSPILADALRQSRYFGQLTGGALDITIQPLVALWGFKDQAYRVPSESQIQKALALTGPNQWRLAGQDLILNRKGIQLDFGAIGKGLAIDAAIQDLRQAGITQGVVDSRSTRYFLGAPPHTPGWPLVIQHPHREQALVLRYLRDQAVSTSGDEEQFFVQDGRRYSHILDPRTGYPVQGLMSVTVVAPTATEADALATAAMLMTRAQIHRILERHPQVEIWRFGGQKDAVEWLEYIGAEGDYKKHLNAY